MRRLSPAKGTNYSIEGAKHELHQEQPIIPLGKQLDQSNFVCVRTTWLTCLWGILSITGQNIKAQWVDHFDNICGLNEWLDIQVEEGWNIQVFETLDISLSHPGALSMMPYTVTWYADYRGPLLYKQATNDFVFTGRVTVTNRSQTGIPGADYSLGGLMVRNPKDLTTGPNGWVPGQEDYVFLSIGYDSTTHPSCWGCPGPHFEVKSTINSNSTLNLSSVNMNVADIRMVRLDPFVLVLYKYPNQSWIVHRRYYRPDLEDTVQVGMVSYTDWNKASTYSMPFHNSHVLNVDLNPDPSNNPGLPFNPDIITQYDYLYLVNTTMPVAWVGLDLTDEGEVSDTEILMHYGDQIPDPVPTTHPIWLGGINQQWNNASNWLPSNLPSALDTIRVNSCACPQANCLVMPSGVTTIHGMDVMEGAIITIPAGATLEIDGPLTNEGTVIIFGQLLIHAGTNAVSSNYGTLDCRTGGSISILD